LNFEVEHEGGCSRLLQKFGIRLPSGALLHLRRQ